MITGQKMKFVGWAIVTNTGVPDITAQSGIFEDAVTDNGAGDMTVTLKEGGLQDVECFFTFQPLGAAAASQLKSFGVVHTSDTAKRITTLQEGAAGAVSALTDFSFYMEVKTIGAD